MPSRQLSTPRIRALFASLWLKWIVALLACLGVLAGVGYATRTTPLLDVQCGNFVGESMRIC
jgi:uncharacterized protein involved in exopolysaccharide biosynthesis